MHPFYPIVNIQLDPASTACFADYGAEPFGGETSLRERRSFRLRLSHRIGVLLELLYKEGYRTFLCPVGGEFGCVAASAVLDFKARRSDAELVPVQARIQSRDKSKAYHNLTRRQRAGKNFRTVYGVQSSEAERGCNTFGDGYSIENSLMCGLSSTVITCLPEMFTAGQMPASLALAKRLDLRIINLCSGPDARQCENRVEPFMQAALFCPLPHYGIEYLGGLWVLEHEYGMEGGDRQWRHLRAYSNFECEWNLRDDGTAGIYYYGRNVFSDTFLYDELTGTLSFSSKHYTIKDLTGNHLELSDCSAEKGVRLLALRKIHWNRPAASIRGEDALSLAGRWLHAGTYVRDDTCAWQSVSDTSDFPCEWMFDGPNILALHYPDKTEERLKYACCPLNKELFIEQNRELCLEDIYRIEELSSTRIRLYHMDGVDIFPEQCRIMVELKKE